MVRFENVGMRYDAGPEILRDVNFALEPGSFTFVTGPSGAGKSTLLKLVFMAERPSRGLITMFGRELATLKRAELPALRRRVGVVFQEFRLLDHLSAFDNVAMPLRLAGQREDEYAHDVEELLSWVGLGNRLDAKPPTLSGGEQQRVAIARAVVAKPDLILADEPTGNLDTQVGHQIIELLQKVHQQGITIVLITHNPEIARLGDRTVHLRDGQIVEDGDMGAIPRGQPVKGG